MERGSITVSQRIPELDGIRGFAIALVLVWHYLACQIQTTAGSPLAYSCKVLSMTWAGVDLFFVLSGFLIARILLAVRGADHYFSAFYIRRICRIFPLYYLSVGAFAIVVMATDLPTDERAVGWLVNDPLPLWTYVIYLQNFATAFRGTHGANWLGISWSLAVEEQFYLILPLMIRYIPSRVFLGLLPWLIVSAPILRTVMRLNMVHGGIAGYVLLPCRWDSLFLGVLGAFVVSDPVGRAWLERRLRHLQLTVVLGILFCIGLIAVKQEGIGSIVMASVGHTVLAILGLAIVLLAVLDNDRGVIRRFFRSSPLVWLGTVSYGIYIFHQPMAGLMHLLLRNDEPRIANATGLAATLLALVATLVLAQLSWRYFEAPIVKYGQRARYS